jgi:hypothetical protein
MIEYYDGCFSENMPAHDAIEKLLVLLPSNTVKALHFGTDKQLDAIRKEVDLKEQFQQLQAEVRQLQAKQSDFLYIPTKQEVDKLVQMEDQ